MSGLYEADFVERLRVGVAGLLDGWGLSPATEVSLLTVSENATFRAREPGGGRDVVVRVHRPGYHGRAEIESELAWIEALRAGAVVVTPAPIPTLSGERVARFDDAGEARHAVAFEHLSGEEPAADADLVGGFRDLGAISARLHGHARAWTRPAGFARKTWNFDTIAGETPHWGRWQDALHLDAAGQEALAATVAHLRERTAEYGAGADRFGLIHADLRLANLLVDGARPGTDRVGVIDFDDCGFGWFGYDFAAAVSFIEEEPFVPALLDAWCEGYRSVAPLAPADEAMIPTFVMLRRMQLTAWIASHAETPTARELGDGFTAGTVRLARRTLATGRPF